MCAPDSSPGSWVWIWMWRTEMAYKRILTIQDISCVGQCSMTVALPILSACGHECCILPTALLSTHTGGFGKPVVTHLTDTADAMADHWKRAGITFDAIYTGYLGSLPAIEAADRICSSLLAPGGVLIADPAMADHGKLYSGLDESYAKAMEAFCRRADVILPNLTEAAMMASLPCPESAEKTDIPQLLKKLDHRCVVLTGIATSPEETGAAVWRGGCLTFASHPRLSGSYHGTGDIFSSAFVGALMQERTPEKAAQIAGRITCECIRQTLEKPAHWYGVKFEAALPELIRLLQA